jgi:hypothetical protein
MKKITIKELQDNIEHYISLYDQGDNTEYIIEDEGKELAILTPFNGPWTVDVKADEETGDSIIELPSRLMANLKWSEGDTLTIQTSENKIILTKNA